MRYNLLLALMLMPDSVLTPHPRRYKPDPYVCECCGADCNGDCHGIVFLEPDNVVSKVPTPNQAFDDDCT